MKTRSALAVILLSFVTLGLYQVVWFVLTKEEMNTRGAGIPSAWWILVPLANIWWLWRHAQGVGHVTDERIQSGLNKAGQVAGDHALARG